MTYRTRNYGRSHNWLKIKLINFIREQARRRWTQNGLTPVNVISGGILLNPTSLTIGFAREVYPLTKGPT